MQGGLTRSSAVKDKFEISNQLGGISKDTWIITDIPTEYQEKSVERKNTNNQLNNSLTSRNAENLFWLGRLCERTMALRSFLKIILNRLNENVIKHGNEQPEFLVVLLKSLTILHRLIQDLLEKKLKTEKYLTTKLFLINPITELLLLINDPKKAGSVVYNMQSLLNTINQVSEKWNHDTRRIINLLEDSLFALKNTNTNNINNVNHALDKLHIRLFSFYGNIYETLPRDNGFYLMEAGKNVERILSLISVFRSTFNYKKSRGRRSRF